MKHFILNMAGVLGFIATALLFNAALQGELPLLGALALVPCAGVLTAKLMRAGLRLPRKRRGAALRQRPKPALVAVQTARCKENPRTA